MGYFIRSMVNEDRQAIIDIYNHYIENSFAAYPEIKFSYQAFDRFLEMSQGYPAGTIIDQDGNTVGFGLLHTYNPIPTFLHTAEATYFLHPDHTGKGLGKILLDWLERKALENGITNILANISSINSNSRKFHLKNGFVECGRFKKIGKKKGQEFDIVWMQKILK